MPTPLTATETLERARHAYQSGRGAGLPELLRLIETLSTDLAKATISEIAELIERDAAVLCRVLTVANTIVHNPHIAPMASITHAIHQIGFHRVRTLAVSLMLIESTDGTANPPEQREAAARALCSSLMAQSCARSLGTVDPELAFTCAALRQFGEIILPAVSLELYRLARENARTQPEDAAFREQFGLTPLDVSRELLGFARLSPEVMQSLRECQPELMAGTAATTYGARLLSVADLGGRMASLALGDNEAGFTESSHSLASRFERLLPGIGESIDSALVATAENVRAFTRQSSTRGLTTPGLRRLTARAGRLTATAEAKTGMKATAGDSAGELPAPPTRPEVAPVKSPSGAARGSARDIPSSQSDSARPANLPAAPGPKPQPATPVPPADDWREKLAAAHVMETPPAVVPVAADPWIATLTFVRDSFGAQECWLFQPQAGGASLPITQGVGRLADHFRSKAAIRADERTVFGVCLSRREHVLIHDTSDAALSTYLPNWFRRAPESPGAFLLMALVRSDRVEGLVLIGWHQAQRITVTPAQTDLARQLFLSTAAARL